MPYLMKKKHQQRKRFKRLNWMDSEKTMIRKNLLGIVE